LGTVAAYCRQRQVGRRIGEHTPASYRHAATRRGVKQLSPGRYRGGTSARARAAGTARALRL